MASKLRFGVTSDLSGLSQGIIVNGIQKNNITESAQARDQLGNVIDIAAFSDDKNVTIDGLYVSQSLKPGTIININNQNYMVTSTGREESNTAFQTASINARLFPGDEPPTPPGPIIPNPSLMFRSVDDQGTYIQLNQIGSPDAVELVYRKNNSEWITYNIGDIIALNRDDVVFLSGVNDYFSKDNENFYYFTIDGSVEAEGNIQSLMNFSENCSYYCFYNLFRDCDDLLIAPQLSATGLADGCYYNMFFNCSSLIEAPSLPATKLANGCYKGMFDGCTSLSTAPQLPAINLAPNCYYHMFRNCTSLTAAPDLPATELVSMCYNEMFRGCSNLSSVNVAFEWWRENIYTTQSWLYNVAEQGVFKKPYSLPESRGTSNIPTNWIVEQTDQDFIYPLSLKAVNGDAIISRNNGASTAWPQLKYKYENDVNPGWQSFDNSNPIIPLSSGDTVYLSGSRQYLNRVNSWGSFVITGQVEVSGNIMSLVNYKHVVPQYNFVELFKDCSGLLTAPQLPATTLAEGCYAAMFRNCTSLTAAPDLPASTLVEECYYKMFEGCSNLLSISQISALKLANQCCYSMFKDCISLTSAPAILPATKLANGCYKGMFDGCTSLSTAPQLPAINLAPNCYYHMFRNCTSLTAAPDLPATELVSMCYNEMFRGCSNLSSVNVAFEWWRENIYTTQSWLYNVAEQGVFKKPYSLPESRGTSNIPTNWIVEQTDQDFIYPLSLKAVNGDAIISRNNGASTAWPQLKYKYENDVNPGWQSFDNSNPIIPLSSGDTVYLSGSRQYLNRVNSWGSFVITGQVEVSGNIMSLVNYKHVVPQYNFVELFKDCSGLLTAPQLPATTLAEGCYAAMFRNCTSLTAAPDLPASTLVEECYNEMFMNCTSLSTAPYLPATTLVEECYSNMFNGCSNLSSISVAFKQWNRVPVKYATNSWVYNVASTGIFTKPEALSEEYGYNRIPTEWRVINKDQPLTFKSIDGIGGVALNQYGSPQEIDIQYNKNNVGWTNYTLGQTIILNQNETVAFSGANDHFSQNNNFYYFSMGGQIEASGNIMSLMNFSDSCTNYCFYGMFKGCSGLLTAPQLPATTLADNCYKSTFLGCTSLTAAPQLPATTLKTSCYSNMFNSCSALTDAPYLPAKTLAIDCYNYMFANCSSLSSINVEFTSWNVINSTNNWVQNVAANGIFYKSIDLAKEHGNSRIPYNWTIQNFTRPEPEEPPPSEQV